MVAVLALVAAACSPGVEVATRESPPTTTSETPVVAIPETTTTTVATTTTTTAVTTTTTTLVTTTTTTAAPVTTTRPPSQPPEVSISQPANLATFQAAYSDTDGLFGADVTFVAEVTDPEGDPVVVDWYSSDEGYLGSGLTITVRIHTLGSDSAQPYITARATDTTGAVGEDTIQIIVWIPSDQG